VVLILFVVASFFVPWPWKLIVLVCGVLLEFGEIAWGRRLARRPPKTGVEAMIGTKAQVLDECRPEGRVRVRGEIWNAVCEQGAGPGETVTIVGEHDLTLDVVPARRRLGRRSSQRGDVTAADGGLS
jgi:membrane-bound serine protease (ClpP class)